MSRRRVACAEHGKIVWNGEVICAQSAGGCGHVWKLQKDADVPPPELDKRCTCGRPLIGRKGTARAICRHCYEQRRAVPS